MKNGQVAIRVLRELGVLFETPCPPVPLPQGAAPSSGPLDHEFFRHTPLWQFEHPGYAYPYAEPGRKPVFETLAPETPLDTVLDKTQFVVLLGAADTEVFRRCLARPGQFLLIFEPDAGRLEAFAKNIPLPHLAKHSAILHGEPSLFLPPLSEILPKELFTLGFPVFFALPGFAEALAQAGLEKVERFIEQVEILFFRHCMYPLSSQANKANLPMRPLVKGLFYDQQLHVYENLTDFATQPSIRPLRKAFAGETAVLVAAGPDLPKRLELLARLSESCVVIAVNNALKPLLAAGIRPHFVVANDTSTHTAKSYAGLPPLRDVSLVAHCLTDLGGEVFPRKFLFGNYLPELFGTRPDLRLHGSVITTAFSLARHMGCVRCVLAGVQLCSDDPWTLAYSRGSIHEDSPPFQHPLTGAFPQLVPVTNHFGMTSYTTLNFLDSSIWLLENIRTTGMPCVNTTRESIVYGPGVEYDEAPEIAPTGLLHKRLGRMAALPGEPPRVAEALANGRHYRGIWSSLAQDVAEIETLPPEAFRATALQALAQFDQKGVSYLVQRFEDFDNRHMHALVFAGADDAAREQGLRYLLEHVRRMALEFAATLARQVENLEALA